jgi:GNAT superfamily N-acetyltransferase
MSIEISTDRTRLDVDLIHRYLSQESYWAIGIPRDLVERSIENSLCFGAYERRTASQAVPDETDSLRGCPTFQQVGFARVVTDYATFGYVSDVFVVASHRGRGVSKAIMAAIRAHPGLQPLRRWHLLTRDAQSLYEQFGFHALEPPERHMESTVANAYAAPASSPAST